MFLLQAPGVAGEPGRLADRLLFPDDLKAHPGRPSRRRTWSQGTCEAWPAASRAFQGIFVRRRLPRRLARRLNPRWQYRRWAMRAARFDVRPAATPDGIAMITVMLHREDIGRLEDWIDTLEAELPPLRRFILAGGSIPGASLHVARTTCRRAERAIVTLDQDSLEPELLIYVNRLSDLLFVMARAVNHRAAEPEGEW